MPDINLLEGREFTVSEEAAPASEEIRPKTAAPIAAAADTPQPPPSPPKTPPAAAVEPPPAKPMSSTPSSYDRPSSWPIVAIIGVVMVVAAVIFLNPFKSGEPEEEPPAQAGQEQPVSGGDTPAGGAVAQNPDQAGEEPGAAEQQGGQEQQQAPDPGLPVQAATLVSVSRLGDFLAAIPQDMRLGFFRYGGSGYLGEIIAASSGTFAEFERNLSLISADLVPKTISEEEKSFGAASMQVRQIQGSIPQTQTTRSADSALDPTQIRSNLSARASGNNLQVRQIEVSPSVASAAGQLNPTTLKLSGSQSDVVNFVQGLFANYYNISLNKITISLLTNDLSDSRVNAVIDLDVIAN